jgi:NAD(P)-dependent dehydrogenase (short-subunit alcohol dehydrogenase family)
MKSVVITGVSTGIGGSAAKLLIQKGYRVFGSLRRQADAERLTQELGERFVPLFFDLTDEAAIRSAAEQVRARLGGETLFGLVNNAGVAVPAPLMHQPIPEFRKQLEINVTAQLIVTQAFFPLLGGDRSRTGAPGRVVNVSSISGRNGSPFVGAYAASKHALEGMTESLRRELMLFGIGVIIVAPGPIATPIWDKADAANEVEKYKHTEYYEAGKKFQAYAIKNGRNGLSADAVGRVIVGALTAKRPRVRYDITPTPFATWMMSILPKRLLDAVIARGFGLRR